MPLYEDLVRRAVLAKEHSTRLVQEAERVSQLTSILREAAAGRAMLIRCAWCDRLKVGDEWLHLEAIGPRQQWITRALRDGSSHGICPDCFDREQRQAEASRAERTADG